MATLKEDVKIKDGKVLYSTKRLTETLNIVKTTLSNWHKEGCPKAANGWWDFEEVLRWRGIIGNGAVKTESKNDESSLLSKSYKLMLDIKNYKVNLQK